MIPLSQFVRRQGMLVLKSRWHALLQATVLALLPYTAWLSVAIIALVTLRKGWQAGCWLLFPVMIASLALSLFSVPPTIAVINVVLTFLPCYIAACALRVTANWRVVTGAFIFQVITAVLLLHVFAPDFIMAQYMYVQNMLREMEPNAAFLAFIDAKTGVNQMALAGYLLGFQAAGVVFSACLSLFFARSIQSQLFYPGGFKEEMLRFRGTKIGFVLLVIVFIATYQQNVLAISLLPVLLLYFLLAGLSLSLDVLTRRWQFASLALLVVALFLLPFIMLPVYVIFGSLDSLFNFRLYLSSDAGKTI